jgi:hypothetical protein
VNASHSSAVLAVTFGSVTVAVCDAPFLVEPAAAVIVSANLHLQTTTGAHDLTWLAGIDYNVPARLRCKASLTVCRRVPPG